MNPLIKIIAKKVIKIIYTDGLYPIAKAYVEKTDNTYDDKALEFLNEFVNDLINKL